MAILACLVAGCGLAGCGSDAGLESEADRGGGPELANPLANENARPRTNDGILGRAAGFAK